MFSVCLLIANLFSRKMVTTVVTGDGSLFTLRMFSVCLLIANLFSRKMVTTVVTGLCLLSVCFLFVC